MADDIYKVLGATIDLWKIPESGDNDGVEATEFWLNHATNRVKVSTHRVSEAPEARHAWLEERVQGGEGHDKMSLLARFVWIEANADDHTVSLSESVQVELRKKFGLPLAYQYFKTFHSGVSALPRVSKPKADRRPYAFCFGPKRAAIWCHTIRKDAPAEPVTEGFLFLRSSPKKEAPKDKMRGGTALQFQQLIEKAPWNPDVVRSPVFPAYLNALVLSKEITKTLSDIGLHIRGVEARTGYHTYQNRNDPGISTDETLGEVSARASGYATKLASVVRKGKMVEKLLDFIVTMTEEENLYVRPSGQSDGDNAPETYQRLMLGNVEVLRERLEMQMPETEYALKRVDIQIEALFNLISQNDNINNLELSVWTKNISLTSQRDAASMKTLAVVTMFFLPGSFISALFSTPLFTWDDVDVLDKGNIGVGTTPQFGLYWIVTVPLTVVTFILYFLWLWWQHKQRKKQEKAAGVAGASIAKNTALLNGAMKANLVERDIIARRRRATVVTDDGSMPMTASSTWRSTWRNTWKKDAFKV